MIAEKIALKKTLAVTLALALGLSLPGGAWAQVVRTGSVAGAGVESAASGGAVFAGMQTIILATPALTVSPLSGGVPILSAPVSAPSPLAESPSVRSAAFVPHTVVASPAPAAAAPAAAVDAHPVIGLINQIQKAGVSLDSTGTRADADKLEQAARALPEGAASRNQLAQLAASIRAASPSGESDGSGKIWDGSQSAGTAASAVPVTGFRALLARFVPSLAKVVGAQKETPAPQPEDPKKYELSVNQVRYEPVPEKLPADSQAITSDDKKVVGQNDALKAIRFALEMKPDHYNLFVAGAEGSGRAMAIRSILNDVAPKMPTPNDLVAVTNFEDKDVPVILKFLPGQGYAFEEGVENFVESLKAELPVALNSGAVGQKKQAIMAQVQAAQQKNQAAFDAKLASIKLAGKFGVYFHVEQGEGTRRLNMVPSFDGKPMTQEDVDKNVAAGKFTLAELTQAGEELRQRQVGVLEAYKTMMETNMALVQKVSAAIGQLEGQAASGLINQHANRLAALASAGPATEADIEFDKRAQARDQQIHALLQGLIEKKFGKFNAAVQVGEGEDGPVLTSSPAIGEHPISDAVAAKLIEGGQFTQTEYDEAKTHIAREALAVQGKIAGILKINREELEALPKAEPTQEARKAIAYVQSMADFAVSNYRIFLGIKEGAEGMKPMPGTRPADPEDFFRVSVLTDNEKVKGAPVVWENNPTYERLFGEADSNLRNMVIPGVGMVKTDGLGGPSFKTGSYMKANGGFLVLDVMSVLKNPGVWPALMNAVRTGEAEITDGGFLGMASMKGDVYHLPAKVKIVFVGSPMIQMLLSQHDEDFATNFQGIAQFQPTIKITDEAVEGFLGFLKHSVAGSSGQIMNLTRDAISRVLEHAARLADSNSYFTAQFGALHGLLQEASYWAQKAGRTEVRGEDVQTALQAKIDREDVHYKRMAELYQKNIFRIDTTGSAVGQINGLAVMGSHGVQMRVTFVVGAGKPGIVSIDHEYADNTGSSFNKALGNEDSFIMREFGQRGGKERLLKAQIRVSYEQNYGGIDGDSSTSTTLYGLLSALSGVPIKQQFAVTGSADQFGNVQAIGGVNEKIEGFFDLCSHRGLTGDQGVIIPKTNVDGLQLRPDVAQAIREGKFHIYAVDRVEQGMEILTGTAYQTIKAKAEARLDAIAKAK